MSKAGKSSGSTSKLHQVILKWKEHELVKLLDYIRRTMSFDFNAIASYLKTKSAEEVYELISLTNSPFYDQTNSGTLRDSLLEMSLSLFQDISPRSVNYSSAVAQAFEDCSQFYSLKLNKTAHVNSKKHQQNSLNNSLSSVPVSGISQGSTSHLGMSATDLASYCAVDLYNSINCQLRGEQGPLLGNVPAGILLHILNEVSSIVDDLLKNEAQSSQENESQTNSLTAQIDWVKNKFADFIAVGMESKALFKTEEQQLLKFFAKEIHLPVCNDNDDDYEQSNEVVQKLDFNKASKRLCMSSMNPLHVPQDLSQPFNDYIEKTMLDSSNRGRGVKRLEVSSNFLSGTEKDVEERMKERVKVMIFEYDSPAEILKGPKQLSTPGIKEIIMCKNVKGKYRRIDDNETSKIEDHFKKTIIRQDPNSDLSD